MFFGIASVVGFSDKTFAESVTDLIHDVIPQTAQSQQKVERIEWVSFEQADCNGSSSLLSHALLRDWHCRPQLDLHNVYISISHII